jgi:hypothetical protein
LLDSLAVVDYPRDRFQVVVALDGPDPALEKIARDCGVDVVVSEVNCGSYAMRNLALDQVGDAEFVLFTDTDCAVSPQWVRAHVAALQTTDLSGGEVRFETGAVPTPAEWVDSVRHLRQRHFVNVLGYAATCNLGVRRAVVEQLRFDGARRSGGDFDFGRRARQAGYSIAYSAEAAIAHPARRSTRAVLRKVWRVAGGAQALGRDGERASQRRDPTRQTALAAARAAGLPVSSWWLLRVAAVDRLCSVAYAVRVPQVIGPAIARRLGRVMRPSRPA